jgi:lysine 2,3-aminomutase
MEGLRGHTSGLAIPTYVIDLPFGGGKVPLQANYVVAQSEGEIILKNYQGRLFRFRNPGDPATGTEIRTDGSLVADANQNLEKIPVPVVRR